MAMCAPSQLVKASPSKVRKSLHLSSNCMDYKFLGGWVSLYAEPSDIRAHLTPVMNIQLDTHAGVIEHIHVDALVTSSICIGCVTVLAL